MKKIFVLAFLFLILTPFVGSANSHDWSITSFRSDILIEETGHVLVTEMIDTQFVSQHGIFREIPYQYENADGSIFYTEIDILSVKQDGVPAKYEESRSGGYVVLKIGDPNRMIGGAHNYEIKYRAAGVLRPFEEYDELYWNVTGFWGVPIASATATVRMPAGQGVISQAACYFGPYGSGDSCRLLGELHNNSIQFAVPRSLRANEGMTIAAGYTKGLVPILTVEAPPSPFNASTLISFIVTLVVALGVVFFLAWTRGRDWMHIKAGEGARKRMPPFAHETIAAEYSPPEKLRPAEIGLLQDETADTLDISSTIVHLASLGYLTIKKEELFKIFSFELTDYALIKQKDPGAELRRYEVMLLEALFEKGDTVRLKDLRNTFYKDLKEIKDELYEEGIRRNFFEKNPKKVRTRYLLGGVAAVFIGTFTFGIGLGIVMPLIVGPSLAIVLAGFIMVLLSRFMSRRSAYGRELWRRVRGYKLFIETAEKHRARFYEEQNLFFEVLPYAIVFGLAQKLSDAFAKMDIVPPRPSWYVGPGAFNPSAFASDMRGFSSTVSNTMASSPSGSSGSGGGGFSGGGFGGGGGGGW